MSFTDQQQRIATDDELKAPWGGRRDGSRFRCYLCGHKFQTGDKWRWVYNQDQGTINFMTCEHCDGPDVRERFTQRVRNFKAIKEAYWWMFLDKSETR